MVATFRYGHHLSMWGLEGGSRLSYGIFLGIRYHAIVSTELQTVTWEKIRITMTRFTSNIQWLAGNDIEDGLGVINSLQVLNAA